MAWGNIQHVLPDSRHLMVQILRTALQLVRRTIRSLAGTTLADAPWRQTDSSPKSLAQPAMVGGSDIARRAYGLYLACGCEPGHDVDDWLQAERELRGTISSAEA